MNQRRGQGGLLYISRIKSYAHLLFLKRNYLQVFKQLCMEDFTVKPYKINYKSSMLFLRNVGPCLLSASLMSKPLLSVPNESY